MSKKVQRILAAVVLVAAVVAGARALRPPKPPKPPRVSDVVQAKTDTRIALSHFVAELKKLIHPAYDQPASDSASQQQQLKQLAEKLAKLPTQGLPTEVATAWQNCLPSWQALANGNPADPTPIQAFNQALATSGYPELRL
jgi:chorismate mutase